MATLSLLKSEYLCFLTQPDNDNYKKLADFLKLRLTDQPVLIGLKSKEHKKAIYWEDVNALSYRKLKLFITKIAKGTEKMYPSDEVVDSPPTDKDEDSDELWHRKSNEYIISVVVSGGPTSKGV